MRIAFATLHYPSHLHAATSLARKVRERGHDVFFVGVPDTEPAVRAAGLEFHAVAAREFPPGSFRERDARLAKLDGLAGFRFSLDSMCRAFDAVANDAPDVLRRAGAEAAVVDQLASGYTAAALRLGLPIIHFAISVHGNPWASTPPAVFGWEYRGGWLGRLRNRVGHGLVRALIRPFRARVIDYYKRHDLPLDLDGPSFGCSTLAQISQMPAALDFPNPELPPWFHHAAPFDDGHGRSDVSFPWDKLDGRPLIYASMGTLQNGVERVFRTIAQACAGLDGQLVLSAGGSATLSRLGTLPGNGLAVGYAPQLELLRRAALCICHAGTHTVYESLAAGVPMVAIPVTNDQPGTAARVAYTRTGVVVPFRKLDTARLRRAVREVLEDARYRENARRLQASMQASNGFERAVDIIDRAFAAAASAGASAAPAERQTA
jgi:UDP:flavonoid glycosyltransferase YjiC (YdhE family)